MIGKKLRVVVFNGTGADLHFSTNPTNEKLVVSAYPTMQRRSRIHEAGKDEWQLYPRTNDGSDVLEDIVAGGYVLGQVHDVADWLTLAGCVDFETDEALADGSLDFYVEFSSGSKWPSDAANFDPQSLKSLAPTLDVVGATEAVIDYEYP